MKPFKDGVAKERKKGRRNNKLGPFPKMGKNPKEPSKDTPSKRINQELNLGAEDLAQGRRIKNPNGNNKCQI